MNQRSIILISFGAAALFFMTLSPCALAQLTDVTQTPNTINAGIAKSLSDQIGTGRGNDVTPDSSLFIIKRDPFRSVLRGRQLFQRKFTRAQGLGPRTGDGIGNLDVDPSLGAGIGDSCATCHGRPHGSAGSGGDVVTRPDSRDAPHLFGLGLVEMLADEITTKLRSRRAQALQSAANQGHAVARTLRAKGINYGFIVAHPDGTVDYTGLEGVDEDLRVKPFFHHGGEWSMRAFAVGAFDDEMGLESVDPDLAAVALGGTITTPSGLVMNGSLDSVNAPAATSATHDADGDGVPNEIPTSLVDHMEFYLLNYFRPGTHRQTSFERQGLARMRQIGCTTCHIQNLRINNDRRVADTSTEFDPQNGVFNRLYTTATPLFDTTNDGSGFPDLKTPSGGHFRVRGIFADFKRHDLGPNFWERNFDGTITKKFMTEPLWGVGTTAPYGHDGRSINLDSVIRRHGGEAQASSNAYKNLPDLERRKILAYLGSLVIFPPPDTTSNLNPKNPAAPNFPQNGHGSIDLSVLFNNPADKE